MPAAYWAGRQLTRVCYTAFGRWEVEGQELVPPGGPLLVVSNHLSYADPPLLAAAIRRPLYFLAKRELFANPIAGALLKSVQTFPVDRSQGSPRAMRQVLGLLAEDKAVVVFPEGHRSHDHALREGMVGTAYLALKSQAPVLPIGITGTQGIPNWRIPFPLRRMKVNIGPLLILPSIEGTPDRSVIESVRDMIMYRIAALLPEDYRGKYK